MIRSVPIGASVVIVDGECIFCRHVVSFILAHDPHGLFLFAHLQGEFGHEVLYRHGRRASEVDSVYVLTGAGTPDERLVWDGRAARAIWPRLFWFAAVLRWIPLFILDPCYRAFAKRRYALFGKYAQCRVPTADERGRFVDVGARIAP